MENVTNRFTENHTVSMVPTGTGKHGKCETIFQSAKIQGILPKIPENGNKYWKSQQNLAVRKVKTMEIGWHTLNKTKL